MLALIDYGMGNIRSVQKAFEHLQAPVKTFDSPEKLKAAKDISGVVLPGVGAFGDCMKNLRERRLDGIIREHIDKDVPYLGICLGFQILFESSEEAPGVDGLKIFKGANRRFEKNIKVPHMGWNRAKTVKECAIFEGIGKERHFYFVHSYYVDNKDKSLTASVTDYGVSFTSSIAKGKLFACQFHPEKSQDGGLQLLTNFINLCS